MQKRVAFSIDMYGAGEVDFRCDMTLQLQIQRYYLAVLPKRKRGTYPDSMFIVPYIASSCRWMMANLFRNQIRGSGFVFPFPNKYFAQERVQWLHFLSLSVFIFATVLLFERTQKPFQDGQGALFGVRFAGRRNEQTWMLSPVR